jgi:hypothetical protein
VEVDMQTMTSTTEDHAHIVHISENRYKTGFWFLVLLLWTGFTFVTGLAIGIIYKEKEPQVSIEHWYASGNDVPKKIKANGIGGGP